VVVPVLSRLPAAGGSLRGGLFGTLLCRSVAPPGVAFSLDAFGG
jgi:hypothetical protein